MDTEDEQVGENGMANKKRSQSLYFKIKDDLKEQIISRQLKADDRIMSEAEICERYDVSRITAKRALDELMWEGYITRKPGKGSFVTYHAIEHMLNGFYSISEEIRRNGLVPSTKLLEFREIIALETSYVPERHFPEMGEQDFKKGAALYAVFQARYGCEPDRSQELFSFHTVSKKEAAALKVVRISYEKDRPVEYTERLFRGDAYTYKIELKKHGK